MAPVKRRISTESYRPSYIKPAEAKFPSQAIRSTAEELRKTIRKKSKSLRKETIKKALARGLILAEDEVQTIKKTSTKLAAAGEWVKQNPLPAVNELFTDVRPTSTLETPYRLPIVSSTILPTPILPTPPPIKLTRTQKRKSKIRAAIADNPNQFRLSRRQKKHADKTALELAQIFKRHGFNTHATNRCDTRDPESQQHNE